VADDVQATLVLAQTGKLMHRPVVLLYGSDYWRKIVNFEALVEHGMMDRCHFEYLQFANDVDAALDGLKVQLPLGSDSCTPAFASSNTLALRSHLEWACPMHLRTSAPAGRRQKERTMTKRLQSYSLRNGRMSGLSSVGHC
jgi:hypothetical protein